MSKREAVEMNNNNEENLITKAPRRPKDDEPPVADANAELKWRGDPTETYSDWKIEIVTQKTTAYEKEEEDELNNKMEVVSHAIDGGKEADSPKIETVVQTYHVHRNHLACGSRKSDYFARVFRASFQEAQAGKSRIELEEEAADAFPQFLDYVYQRDKALEISVETATALHFLGEYFEVEYLRWDARQYIKREMSFENVSIFLKQSGQFCNSSIRDLVSDFLVDNILDLSELDDSSLRSISEGLDQELLFDVLSRINSQDKRTSESSSCLTAFFSNYHSNSLDSSTFQKLTDSRTLPHVDFTVALMLASEEDKICVESEDCKDLSSLQQRCATALADEFKVVLGWIETDDHTLSDLKERKPEFLLDLLVKSWKVD